MKGRIVATAAILGLLCAAATLGVLALDISPADALRSAWRALRGESAEGAGWEPAGPGAIEVEWVGHVELPEGMAAPDVRRVEVEQGQVLPGRVVEWSAR